MSTGNDRLGFVVDFLSHAAIVGFMGGAATVVCLQQLKSILGLEHFTHDADLVSVMRSVFTQIHEVFFTYFNRWFSYYSNFKILFFIFFEKAIKFKLLVIKTNIQVNQTNILFNSQNKTEDPITVNIAPFTPLLFLLLIHITIPLKSINFLFIHTPHIVSLTDWLEEM